MSRMSNLVALVALFVLATALGAYAADGAGKSGVITAVDAKAKTLTVKFEARPLTITCNDKTTITLDGKASTFDEAVKVDNNATVVYSKDGEARVATKVDATTAPKKEEKK